MALDTENDAVNNTSNITEDQGASIKSLKVVRECFKEYSSGIMYFDQNFFQGQYEHQYHV